MLDFIRIACAVPPVRVGDTRKNASDICKLLAGADRQGADLLVFPELALTGYTCQDLFFQDVLYQGVLHSILPSRLWSDFPFVPAQSCLIAERLFKMELSMVWYPRPIFPTTMSFTRNAGFPPVPR